MDWFINHLATFVTRRPKTTWLLIALAIIVSLFGFRYQREPWRSFLSERSEESSNPEIEQLDEMKASFGVRRPDMFLLVEGEDLFTSEHVHTIRDLVSQVESLPQIDSVFFIDDIPVLNVFGLADPILPPEGASEEGFRQGREQALSNPLIAEQLVSKDGNTMLLPVRIDWLNVKTEDDVSDGLLAHCRDVLANDESDVQVRLTGDVPILIEQMDAYRRNQRKFQTIGFVLGVGLATLLFRSVLPILIVGLAPVTALIITFGCLRWWGVSANPMTDAVLPVLLALMGVTDGVHLMVHLRKRRAAGDAPGEAARSALREVGSACILTSLTTAVGFGSLMLAESDFVTSFGSACAVGVLITLVCVLTIIPLLTMSPIGSRLHIGLERDLVFSNVWRLQPMMFWLVEHRRVVSVLGIALTLVSVSFAFRLDPESKLSWSLPSASEETKALMTADQKLGGIELAQLVVEWEPELDGNDEEIVATLRDAKLALSKEPELRSVLSIVDVLESLPGNRPVDPKSEPSWYADSESGLEQGRGETFSANELRLDLVDLLPAELRRSLFRPDQHQALVIFRAQDIGVGRYEKIFKEMEADFRAVEQAHPGFKLSLTGDVVVRSRRIYQIVVDLAKSLGAATLIIFGMMALAFRSLRLALISLVPNLFPLGLTAFMLAVLDRPLNVSTVCAFTVCLGMAVDDTIHFMNRYQRLRAKGIAKTEATVKGFLEVGSALILTTVVLMVGFATVLTSELPSQRTFAGMAVATIGAALLGDMIFLPALLSWFDRDDVSKSKQLQADQSERDRNDVQRLREEDERRLIQSP